MNKESIAKYQQPEINRTINNKDLEVISVDNKNIKCSIRSWNIIQKRKVLEHQLVSIYTGGNRYYGVIQSVNNNEVIIKSPLTLTLSEIEGIKWKKWWEIAGGKVYIVKKTCFVPEGNAELKVYCNNDNVKNLELVRVKWSLYYNEEVVIKGIDWEAPGLCSFIIYNYSWKEGNYKLYAKRVFYDQPVGSDSVLLVNKNGVLSSERELYLD